MTSHMTNNQAYADNIHLETGIGPMTDKFLNSILNKLNTENFKGKLADRIVDPVTEAINRKIRPYIITAIILYCILLILLFVIIYLVVRRR